MTCVTCSCIWLSQRIFLFLALRLYSTDLSDREPSCFFLFICCFAYQFVSFCMSLNISGLKNISNISQGELSWVIWKFLFIPGTPENAGFWTVWICSFYPNSKSVFAHLGRALHILSVPLSGSGWKTSSSSSLLLKGEFTLHVSLSESSLKLPPSESKTFTISLISSVLINIFCEVFSELKLGLDFSIWLVALQI